jgi:hypothetical protein
MREFMDQVRTALVTSWRRPQRRTAQEAPGFLESDYFAAQISDLLTDERLSSPARNLSGLTEEQYRGGGIETVGDLVRMDLATLAQRTGLSFAEAVRLRREALGLPEPASVTD